MESVYSRKQAKRIKELYAPDDFKRKDESDDARFYAVDRMVSHLDRRALLTVEGIIGDLIIEDHPVILDLMVSWDSHLPPELKPAHMVGLGMNLNEMAADKSLDQSVVHDLNKDPRLPFDENTFDAVLNVVSVDYLVDPLAVFTEVGRILKPGGIFLTIFSNRWFEPKATNIWRRSGENERFFLVDDWFGYSGLFGPTTSFVSKGLPRPSDDKYAGSLLHSDPVYAMWAEKIGANTNKPRPYPEVKYFDQSSRTMPKAESPDIAHTLTCPHCGGRLKKWQAPQTPFTQWDNEYMYVCFNDHCPYLLRGFEAMGKQGNVGTGYRLMFNPQTKATGPILVHSLNILKDGIMD